MAFGIHIDAFKKFLPMAKRVEEAAAAAEFEMVREEHGSAVEWVARFRVTVVSDDIADVATEAGEIVVSRKQDTKTLWAVMWQINGQTVAKLDMESKGKDLLDEIKTPRGRLNRRAKQRLPEYLPHWMFISEQTGELDEHHTDSGQYPPKMPLERALPKWCKSVLNIDFGREEIKFFRMEGPKQRRSFHDKDLFGEG